MSNVLDYVKTLRKAGEKVTNTNPNSDTSLLKLELIEYYKNNITKAQELVKSIEENNTPMQSTNHSLHYNAAVIAIRGYSVPTLTKHSNTPVIVDTQTELEKLKSQGWVPLISTNTSK